MLNFEHVTPIFKIIHDKWFTNKYAINVKLMNTANHTLTPTSNLVLSRLNTV
jgi:hypothetical protein